MTSDQAAKKKRERTVARQAFGLTILTAADRRVRQLRGQHAPSLHGHRLWSSSWAIMDYLAEQGLPRGARVLDVGCGWGLAGIFCARRFAARVTAVDADPEVFPFLHLHAALNQVEVCTRQASFSDLDGEALRGHEVMLGADICFWDELTQPLLELVERALQAGIQQIVLADPGRPPFHALSDRCVARLGAETKSWELDEPVRVRAELLIVGTLPVAGG